ASLWHSRRTRFALLLTIGIAAASILEVWWYPHYAAPFTAAILILAVQSFRYLRQWKYGKWKVGDFLVGAIPVAVLVVTVAAETKAIATHQTFDQIETKKVQKSS